MAMPGLNLFGGAATWIGSGGAIAAMVLGIYLYGRHAGAESIRTENAHALAALNATISDLNAQLTKAENAADDAREQALFVFKSSPHTAFPIPADVAAKLNGIR